MTKFIRAIKQHEFTSRKRTREWYQYMIEGLDISRYRSQIRKIHHVFHKPSKELAILILNFGHYKECAVKAHCDTLSRYEMGKAIKLLLVEEYITVLKDHYHNPYGQGRSRVYQRTELFNNTFKFRLPETPIVLTSEPSEDSVSQYVNVSQVSKKPTKEASKRDLHPAIHPGSHHTSPLYRANLASKSGIDDNLSHYEVLLDKVRLSMSKERLTVNPVVTLYRADGKRLYAKGANNYQGLPVRKKNVRKYLLINGEPTAEIDYDNLHPNLLLNICGYESDNRFYERILDTLGLKVTKERRKFIKTLVCASLNINSKWAFTRMVKTKYKEEWESLLNGILPRKIYKTVKKTYPLISAYICWGDRSDWLQTTDSEIMIEVLETLAKENIVALPLHDSIILPSRHKSRGIEVMKSVYKDNMGFDIGVKVK